MKIELKRAKTRIFYAAVVIVCVFECVCHVDGGYTPLPTHLQQYCDPASLVPIYSMHAILYVMIGESECLSGIYTAKEVKHFYEN